MSRNRKSDGVSVYDNAPNNQGQFIPLQELPVKPREEEDVPYGSPSFNMASRRNNNSDFVSSEENVNLLNSTPVKLHPGWEDRASKDAETLFKPVKEEFNSIPTDRYKMVYLIIMLHGIGTLMPWNMFITANSYFSDYKLGSNYTVGDSAERYQKDFLAYVGISAQLPNVICNGLNLIVQMGGSLTVRIVWSIFIEVIVFIFTIVLAMLDSSTWPGTFFWLTMASIVILNMANGVYQNTVFGIAGKLPMKYTNAVVLGSNISGVLTAIINIISLAASPNLRTAAIYYFLAALFVLLACFDTYFALPLIRFFRYHSKKADKDEGTENTFSRPPLLYIFKKVWPQCLNVYLVFFVTLSLFPNIHAGIRQVDPNFFIPSKYFTPVTCFLTFNLFAMIGNIFPNWIRWPGKKYLWIPVVLRFAFIPLFMFCNYNPDERNASIPYLIDNDWIYFTLAILLGITSGYFSSLAMMYAPSCVEPKYAATAGMMAALFLVMGIFSGINFSLLLGNIMRGDFL